MSQEKVDIQEQAAVMPDRQISYRARLIYGSVGFVLFSIGTAGALIPGVPTTIFWIISAYCFTRSFPQMRDWIYRQGRTGRLVETVLEERALSRSAKMRASLGVVGSFMLTAFAFTYLEQMNAAVAAVLAACCLLVIAIIWKSLRTIEDEKIVA